MSDADEPASGIDYSTLLKDALRSVARKALERAAREGMPDPHHFYITFRTDAPGVVVSEVLRRQYPTEMTIVLQHQFWGLTVESESFSVTLRFSGAPTKLVIPFAAMTAFVDPGVSFGLRFTDAEEKTGGDGPPPMDAAEGGAAGAGVASEPGAKVVAFRPKRD